MNIYLKIYFDGLAVLATALILNALAKPLGMSTWYDFIQKIAETGLSKALSQTNPASILFMFAVYPFLLGLSVFLLNKILG